MLSKRRDSTGPPIYTDEHQEPPAGQGISRRRFLISTVVTGSVFAASQILPPSLRKHLPVGTLKAEADHCGDCICRYTWTVACVEYCPTTSPPYRDGKYYVYWFETLHYQGRCQCPGASCGREGPYYRCGSCVAV